MTLGTGPHSSYSLLLSVVQWACCVRDVCRRDKLLQTLVYKMIPTLLHSKCQSNACSVYTELLY